MMDLGVGVMNGKDELRMVKASYTIYQVLGEFQNQPTSRSDATSSRPSVRYSEGGSSNGEHDVWTW